MGTGIRVNHFRELGGAVLDPDDPDDVRDVLVAAGLLVVQLLLAKATKWIAGNANDVFIVTADCISGELSRSSQFGCAFNSRLPVQRPVAG